MKSIKKMAIKCSLMSRNTHSEDYLIHEILIIFLLIKNSINTLFLNTLYKSKVS